MISSSEDRASQMDSLDFIFDFHNIMRGKGINLVYEGEITQEITKSVLSMAEKNMESSGEETSIKKKVFNVMIECLQNICKHSVEMTDDLFGKSSIFVIGRENSDYIISTGNVIKNDNINLLSSKLEELNNKTTEEVKLVYKDALKNNKLSDKGGAGLGFIDIIRRTNNKFIFEFDKMNENYSFFTLKVKVSK